MWFAPLRLLRLVRTENKALKAELSALRFQLEAERVRNQQREHELLDRALQAVQLHALSKTPLTPAEKATQPAPTPPKRVLTTLEEMEREQWGAFAEEAGHDKLDGYRRWDLEHGLFA